MDKNQSIDAENTEMEAFDLTTGLQLWSKRYPHRVPILHDSDSGALLLMSDLSLQTATDATAHSGGKFITASDKKGEWIPTGLLVEVISDGMRLGAFYGTAIAGDGKLGLIAATNREQEIILYDATNGKELKRATVANLPRAARFIPEKKELLVLTANQSVYTIDLPDNSK
jgi:hypothetical protein